MKACVASIIFLLIGLATGFYIGYRDFHKHIADEAVQQLVESGESSDALLATFSVKTIGLIESGQNQKAVQMLSFPLAHYYYTYSSSQFTNKQRLKLRAMIEELASTNQMVAAQMAQDKKWVGVEIDEGKK